MALTDEVAGVVGDGLPPVETSNLNATGFGDFSSTNVRYWRSQEAVQNFGDYLTEFFLSELFLPLPVDAASVHIIGSVLDDMFIPHTGEATPKPVIFWGCGLREPGGLSITGRASAKILSVRGPRSASELGFDQSFPQGDPALILPALYTPRRSPYEGRTICIPHFHDNRGDDELTAISGCDFVVRTTMPPERRYVLEFIDAIASSDFVLSSALHGAVVAAAFGRPFAFWDNGHIDLPFKWEDFAASVNIPMKYQRNIDEARRHYAESIKPRLILPSLWSSLATAPFLMRPEALLKILRHELRDDLPSTALEQIDTKIAVLQQSRPHVEHLVARINARTQALEVDAAASVSVIKQLRIDFATTQANLEGQVSSAEGEMTRLRDELATARTRFHAHAIATESEAARLKAELAAATELAEREARKLREELISARDRVHKLERNARSSRWLFKAAAVKIIRSPLDASLRVRRSWRKRRPVGIRPATVPDGSKTIAPRAHITLAEHLRLLRDKRHLKFAINSAILKFEPILPKNWVGRMRRRVRKNHLDARKRTYHPRFVGAQLAQSDVPVNGFVHRISLRPPVVLMVDSIYPRVDRDSGSVDAVNYIQIFQDLGYQVVFVADAEFGEESHYRKLLEKKGVLCIAEPQYRSLAEFLQENGRDIDVCFLSRVYSGGRHLEAVRRFCPSGKIMFNTVDLHYLREEREARLTNDRKALNKSFGTREREFALTRLADAAIVVSSDEEERLVSAVPGAFVSTIPLMRSAPGRVRNFSQRQNIGFIGGYLHKPNVDAILYFLDEIWPLIREDLPEAKFLALGADMPKIIKNREDPGFDPIGYVKDLAEPFETLRLMVAPLRYGAGAKGKVVSALAHGVPCVASPVAAEGMGLIDGQTIAIGLAPSHFAKRVVELYTNEAAWSALSDAGHRLISERYSLAFGSSKLREILSAIGARVPAADPPPSY